MRIGAFEINEPPVKLKDPHAMVMLRPWVDVGSVGTLTLARLETQFAAQELGKLAQPGNFFDFTRYRPLTFYQEGRRRLNIPNSPIYYAKRKGQNDLIFLHLLEPHSHGEEYAESVISVLKEFNVQRYCLLGSMYDMVPHTRPLPVTGGGVGKKLEPALKRAGIEQGRYEGPTTIMSIVPLRASEMAIETLSLIVHLPQYTETEEDHIGAVRLMQVLSLLYDVAVDENDVRKAEQERKQIDAIVNRSNQLKQALAQLEASYDTRLAKEEQKKTPELSPEVEKFLKEMDKRFRQS
ncbi:MAG: PAC2 family protein [Chloroflexota bacterium]